MPQRYMLRDARLTYMLKTCIGGVIFARPENDGMQKNNDWKL